MADNTLDAPSSFGIVDTIASSSQELIDSFLDGDTSVTANPEEIKDIKTQDAKAPAKEAAKEADTQQVKEEPLGILDLDDIKEEDDEEEEPVKQEETKSSKKSLGKKVIESKDAPKEESETQDAKQEGDFNPFMAFSKELYSLGAFVKDGDDDEEVPLPSTPEEFLETFNTQMGKKAEMALDNFLSRFGEDYQQAFEAIFVNGVDPREYFQTYNNIQNFAEADLSSEQSQEAIVREALKELDYEDEDIKTEIERLKSYGDLEEVAKKHHKVLVKKEAQKLQELAERQEQVRQQQLAVKRQFANSVVNTLQEKVKAKEFDGIPINPRLAEEVQEMLLVEKWKNAAGESLTDFDVEILNLKRPENHANKVKVALLLKILKNDPNLSTIKKSAITKQTNQLFNEVVRNQSKTSTSAVKGSAHWGNL